MYYAYVDSLERQLNYDSGSITLNDLAVVDLPDGFRYLDPAEANRILVESWNNPPSETLGMIIPRDVNPYSFEGWGVVVTYEEDGHVADEEAEQIDFQSVMTVMKEDIEEENALRRKEGYEPYNLAGWAEEPHYDPETHKLYWALELEFGESNSAVSTLNYNVRVLGREGVLVLNAVSGMEQLDEVRSHMNEILTSTRFTNGNRYMDYNPSIDRAAAYGIGALIAGKMAAKTGLFKLAMTVLAKGWKYVLLLVAGITALLRRVWISRKNKQEEILS